MGLFDRFRAPQAQQAEILTKAPAFAVTQFQTNNPFTSLVAPESNYFDQYILYNAKAIDYISNKVASSEISLFDSKDNEIDKNDLWDDLQSFNPYMTLWEARKLVVMHKYITGAAYWYIDREPMSGKKADFYPLDPTSMQMKTGASGLPEYYQYTDAGGKMVNLPLEDVIYFRRINPSNWFEGQSVLKEMTYWSNAYASGAQYNMNKLGNSANVDKFLVFEGISEDNRKMIEERLQNKYVGPRNAGRTGVLNEKMEVVDLSASQKDLDYVNGMKMLRQDILAGYGIPEALFFPSATNSNTKEAVRLFQSDTLEPLMQQEKAALNEQLIPKYGSPRAKVGNVHFSFKPVVEEDQVELTAQARALFESGLATRNEGREKVGMEPTEGPEGLEYFSNVAPADPNTNLIEDDPEDIAEDTAKQIKLLSEKTLSLAAALDHMVEKHEEGEFITKNIKLAEDQEAQMHASAEALFRQQFKTVVDYLNKTGKPTVRGVFDYESEKAVTANAFKESYMGVISNSNSTANIEIKQKFFKQRSSDTLTYKAKSLSGSATDELAKHIDYFSGELTTTTQKKLRKAMAQGTDDGFDTSGFIKLVQNIFNGFVDGVDNIEVLESFGVYEPDMMGSTEGVKYTTGSRYARILDAINAARTAGEMTAGDVSKALKALRGLISPGDQIGAQIDTLLTSIYKVNKEAGISYARAVTIARTESTYARNLGFDDTYTDNPFIIGKTWRSLHDANTRHEHSQADGQVVAVGESFSVGGDKMKFPGDSSEGASAGNTINCRCRITAVVTD